MFLLLGLCTAFLPQWFASLPSDMLSTPTLAAGLVATASLVAAGPCDIYASGNTPCVAAHSTTRALYNAFSGALYQVQRGSDGTTTTIAPLTAGGVANAATQDKFCAGTTCVITIIYDQSGKGNHLTQAPPGGAASGPEANGYDNLAGAIGAPVTLNGNKAYGVFISPGTGYRNDKTNGIATKDAPEGMYAVLDGTHYNGGCCFDYGNAEVNNHDTGSGHMEAIYFGDSTYWGSGSGSGPWIMADVCVLYLLLFDQANFVPSSRMDSSPVPTQNKTPPTLPSLRDLSPPSSKENQTNGPSAAPMPLPAHSQPTTAAHVHLCLDTTQ